MAAGRTAECYPLSGIGGFLTGASDRATVQGVPVKQTDGQNTEIGNNPYLDEWNGVESRVCMTNGIEIIFERHHDPCGVPVALATLSRCSIHIHTLEGTLCQST